MRPTVAGALLLCLALTAIRSEPPASTGVLLDENVRVVHFEQLTYPLAARLRSVQGVVVIRASLSDTGAVASALPLSGPKELIQDCVKNAQMWEFDPAKSREAIIVYVFQIKGLCQSCQSGFEFYPPNLVYVSMGKQVVTF